MPLAGVKNYVFCMYIFTVLLPILVTGQG